jgi:hypothetical protein
MIEFIKVIIRVRAKGAGNMTVRNKGAWVLAGLAALVVTSVGGREAQAGATVAAIGVTGKSGQVNGSDPFYYYDFQITLNAGFQWEQNDYFLVNSIDGVTPLNPPGHGNNPNLPTPGSGSIQPSPNFSSPIITLLNSSPPYASSLEWINNSSTIVGAMPNGTYVGDFIIFTSVSVNNPEVSVTFDSQMHDSTGGIVDQTGVTVVFNASTVPEPSSVILFVTGATALPLLVLSQRRRKSKSMLQAA